MPAYRAESYLTETLLSFFFIAGVTAMPILRDMLAIKITNDFISQCISDC